MKTYIGLRVERLNDEGGISIKTVAGVLELYVDESHLTGDVLKVELITEQGESGEVLLVELPVEPIWGGTKIAVYSEQAVHDEV